MIDSQSAMDTTLSAKLPRQQLICSTQPSRLHIVSKCFSVHLPFITNIRLILNTLNATRHDTRWCSYLCFFIRTKQKSERESIFTITHVFVDELLVLPQYQYINVWNKLHARAQNKFLSARFFSFPFRCSTKMITTFYGHLTLSLMSISTNRLTLHPLRTRILVRQWVRTTRPVARQPTLIKNN